MSEYVALCLPLPGDVVTWFVTKERGGRRVSRQQFQPMEWKRLITEGATQDSADVWPLRSFLELGALPTAVPCARLPARHLVWEWGLDGLVESSELLASRNL